ncbi:MAG: DnaD domain protein [Clostridia bacterium]|nr:DnaD domain protein [Clostridia bacterium]
MAFCKFSSEFVANKFTIVDNIFMEQYLPNASSEQCKVYLYGLYLCSNSNTLNASLATLDSFSQNLGISPDDVMDAFEYWQDLGLVQIIACTPPEVQYMPIKGAIAKKKFKPDKYLQFNLQAQNILSGRQITPNEFAEYYTLIETFHLAPEALLMIMQYCVDNKGTNVGYSYILTVAKNWAYEGVTTMAQVEEKLQEYNEAETNLKQIMKSLGSAKKATFEERQQYLKWINKLGFNQEVILYVASLIKKGGFVKIDSKLNKYAELKLFSVREIQEYESNKETMFNIAKEISKTIGVYYENLEIVVESYVNPWIQRGYNEQTLKIIATYCFKNSIRNLEGMDNIVNKLYEQGLLSVESIAQFIAKAKQQDEQIKKILTQAKLLRNVTAWDRDFYRTWTYSWNMPQEVIEYAASLSCDKAQPMQYVNKILGSWFEQKINTLEQAKLAGEVFKSGINQDNGAIHSRTYSKEEIDSIIKDIDEIEI